MVLINLFDKFYIDQIIDNDRSAWTTECIDGEYINISIYSPLSRSTLIELPDKLKNSKKA